jgi:hypothetical protein
MKLFKISDYEKNENVINVFTETDQQIDINYTKFMDWLTWDERREWVMDYSEGGEHIQKSGTLSDEEYWNSSRSQIIEDLYDFIICRQMDWQKATEQFLNQIKSIAS